MVGNTIAVEWYFMNTMEKETCWMAFLLLCLMILGK